MTREAAVVREICNKLQDLRYEQHIKLFINCRNNGSTTGVAEIDEVWFDLYLALPSVVRPNAHVTKDTVVQVVEDFSQSHGLTAENYPDRVYFQCLQTDLMLSEIQLHRLNRFKMLKDARTSIAEEKKMHFVLMKMAQLLTDRKETFEDMPSIELLKLCHRTMSSHGALKAREEDVARERKNDISTNEFGVKRMRKLEEMDQQFRQDFRLRRKMMLLRCEVTLKSFLRSPSIAAEQREKIRDELQTRQNRLSEEPVAIGLEKVLEMDVNVCQQQYQSVSHGSEASHIKNLRIGSVPDRGGRIAEMTGSRIVNSRKPNRKFSYDAESHQKTKKRWRNNKKK